MLQRLRKGYPVRLEIISLALLAYTLYLVISSYASLPDRIPTHFDFQGVPDRWGSKAEVLVFPILSVALYAMLTGITVLFTVVTDPRKLINLPQRMKDAITEAQAEKLRVFFMRSLFALKVLVQGLMAWLVYATIEVALGRNTGLGAVPLFFVAAILAVVGYMVWKSFKITGEKA